MSDNDQPRNGEQQLSWGDLTGPKNPEPPKKRSSARPAKPPRPGLFSKGASRASDRASESQEQVVKSTQPQVVSVSQLNSKIKGLLEGSLSLIWLKGEISNFKAHSSGHYYFSLKDQKSQINAVMFRGYNQQLKFKPEVGMEVIVRGKVTVYEPRGNYQFFCETMEPVGAGALQMQYEQLKAKLQSEGLFDAAKKRTLPELPQHIVLVTSPTGAAVRDMLNVLGRRYKGAKVTLVPCLVQGAAAAKDILRALNQAEELHQLQPVDVVICGRGGGSMEDLWAFNDEALARKIAGLEIPIVSAVGHEVDFTIADFVADLRAPTPSAAAELVVRNAAELTQQVIRLQRRLMVGWKKDLQQRQMKAQQLTKRLIDPQRTLQDQAIRCDDLIQRLEMAMSRLMGERRSHVQLMQEKLGRPEHRIEKAKQKLVFLKSQLDQKVSKRLESERQDWKRMTALLESLSPLKVVERGYSLVTIDGKVVKDSQDVEVGETIHVRLARGELSAKIEKKSKKIKK